MIACTGRQTGEQPPSLQPHDRVCILLRGRSVATAAIVNADPAGRFHQLLLGDEYVTACNFQVTDAELAAGEKAWWTDGDGVTAGETPLDTVGRNCIIMVARRDLQLLPSDAEQSSDTEAAADMSSHRDLSGDNASRSQRTWPAQQRAATAGRLSTAASTPPPYRSAWLPHGQVNR